MLSYRHGFHAGNHADVLKHSILSQIVRFLLQKNKPFSYIESHAGAGIYRLDSEWARMTGEATSGIDVVLAAENAPEPLSNYIALCRQMQGEGCFYPGSPEVVRTLCRPTDQLTLMELHPAEFENLKDNLAGYPGVHLHNRDGYAGLRALCPPEPRRGFCMVDPSYETADDWTKAAEALLDLNHRWPAGMLVLWYPILGRKLGELRALKDRFYASGIPGILTAELLVNEVIAPAATETIEETDADDEGDSPVSDVPTPGFGLAGSGILIVRPPWKLAEELEVTLPWLASILGKNGKGSWNLEWINEAK